ncbi:MAG: membrane protein insertion efficiency factor YidD [Thermoanaerobaculia bacterium]|nr:membrane protein insertion efficiency factor YidD [Thermoanaerobaculia bacterium]
MRAPQRQVSARLLVAAIDLYQRTLSPWAAVVGARCRFEPTCSRYAEVAIGRLGAARGLFLTAGRLARCGPWTPQGTVDPPPRADAAAAGWNLAAESARIGSQ